MSATLSVHDKFPHRDNKVYGIVLYFDLIVLYRIALYFDLIILYRIIFFYLIVSYRIALYRIISSLIATI